MPPKTDKILPSASDEEDELESEEEYSQEVTAHTTVKEMIQETIAECPTAGAHHTDVLLPTLLTSIDVKH